MTSNRLTVLAHEINAAHLAAQQHAKKSVESAISAGEALLEAKDQLKHGEWLPWLRNNCKISERSARVYMRLAKHKDEVLKNGSAADLSIRGVLDAIEHGSLAANAAAINAITECHLSLCAEIVRCLEEARASFTKDNEFEKWIAEELLLAGQPRAIAGILRLPDCERAEALYAVMLGDILSEESP